MLVQLLTTMSVLSLLVTVYAAPFVSLTMHLPTSAPAVHCAEASVVLQGVAVFTAVSMPVSTRIDSGVYRGGSLNASATPVGYESETTVSLFGTCTDAMVPPSTETEATVSAL